jgi:hypothetical protein
MKHGFWFRDSTNGDSTLVDEQRLVTFRFGNDYEIRYVARIPEPGDLVTHGRELWVVTSAPADEEGGAIVICAPEVGRSRRRGLRTTRPPRHTDFSTA